MSKHTPGPWAVDESDYGIYQRGTGDQIAEVFSHHPPSELEANARLIARAPEMADTIAALTARVEELEAALRRLLLEFDFMVENKIIPDVRNDMIFVNARAAITKGERK